MQKPVLVGLGRKCVGLHLIFALGPASAQTPLPNAPASEVVVEGNSAALQNLGRAVQSQEAQSPFLPNKNAPRTQPNLVLPDMGDPGGDALSPVDERRIGERIMREIRADPDYSNDLPIYDFLNQMDRRLLQAAKRLQLGGANALGKVKFLFPNAYSIYFHDTPSKSLFSESRRAFSQALMLRRRCGFKGDIRATGDVLVDQLSQMQRCGFSSAVLRADQNLAKGRELLEHFSGFYQGDVTQPQPLFAR
jgi:hypothetical protein